MRVDADGLEKNKQKWRSFKYSTVCRVTPAGVCPTRSEWLTTCMKWKPTSSLGLAVDRARQRRESAGRTCGCMDVPMKTTALRWSGEHLRPLDPRRSRSRHQSERVSAWVHPAGWWWCLVNTAPSHLTSPAASVDVQGFNLEDVSSKEEESVGGISPVWLACPWRGHAHLRVRRLWFQGYKYLIESRTPVGSERRSFLSIST